MRSPMTFTPENAAVCEAEQMPRRIARGSALGVFPESAAFSARMNSGVVPQHPPKIETPSAAAPASASANVSGVMV